MVGTIVGTYRLEELLGDGGLGGVYRAVDGASGKEAAFRVFAREVSADAMLADRLRAMAPALKKLQHPNIAAFFELVSVGADLALFIEYVPGASLEAVRDPAGRLDTNVSVSCAVQVLRALEAAHSAGVLHHALRPSNVMVTRQGTVKVLDFGIGHALGANRKTREDRLLTVLAYLAPEQIQNQPGDARSDIYAAGVLLYQLLTGKLPFDHKTEFALRQAHLSEPPAAPRTIVPGLPEWLDQAVLRALAKHPASRYQNATEFRAVLEAALGLSTSREAAIVRQRDGAPVETFAAAPPIPPSAPAAAGGALAERTGSAPVPPANAVAAPGADTAETVVAAPAGGRAAGAAVTRAAVSPPAAAAKAAARGPLVLAASTLVALGLVAAGAYVWLRGPAPPAPAELAPAAEQAAAAPALAVTLPEAPAAQRPAQAVEPASPAPPPAPAGPAATPTQGTVQAPGRKPQAKPAAGQKPAAPVPATPVLATTGPLVVTTPPEVPAPAAAKVPDVSYRKVKLITQAGSSERSTDVVMQFSDDRLIVTPAGGGAALRSVRYAEITAVSYSKAEKKRLGFIKSARHLLAVETAGEPLLLRLDNDNVQPILAAIEARTGQTVSR
ncbi:MAG: serine/threonine protein kinase [Vicinamibacterales bacterium]|jgi:serine/threonine-protein kinase|nr:serine/threonine protein kinase [Vicinamibacterales bacterium]